MRFKSCDAVWKGPLRQPLVCNVLVIIGVCWRTLVVDEMGRIERRGYLLEGDRGVGKVEAVGKIVGRSISVPKRGQIECHLDKFQDAAEVVSGVRNVSGFSMGDTTMSGTRKPYTYPDPQLTPSSMTLGLT
jgi:hypothetical protein